MLRKRPGKGFPWPLRGLLAGALIQAGLASGPARPGPAQAPAWWEIRLSVELQGEYSIRCEGPPVSGEYRGRIIWEGRLEPDGEDFLLLHLKTDVPEWSLRETAGQGETASLLDASKDSLPALRLNYILKEAGDVEIDFEIQGATVPRHEHPLKVPLELPRSAGRTGIRSGYSGLIRSGTNRVVLPEKDLDRRRPERSFAWTWGQIRRLDRDSRAFVVFQSHEAAAVVALIRH